MGSRRKPAAKPPVIVAMKGHRCTGKSTLARILVKVLGGGSTIIDYDDIRSCTAPIHQILSTTAMTMSSEACKLLDEISYEAVWRIVSTHLSLLHSVVVDSPLLSEERFNRLEQLAASTGAKLFIIECKPTDESEWRRRLEEQQQITSDGTRWYKPPSWEDLQALLREYSSDGQADYDCGDVPKLVVDTTAPTEIKERVRAAERWISKNNKGNHDERPAKAKSIGKRPNEEGNGEEDQAQTESEKISPKKKRGKKGLILDRHKHPLSFSDELTDEDISSKCSFCWEPISGPNYNCTKCSYFLHKSCAEFPREIQVPYLDHPLSAESPKFGCDICIGAKTREPSYKCDKSGCKWRMHHKCAQVPASFKHELHDHLLQLEFKAPDSSTRCKLCRESCNTYYCCRPCDFRLHVYCAFLPFTVLERDHHRHPVTLALAPKDNSDEYYCDLVCEERRDPDDYVYYCSHPDCEQYHYAAHIYCLVNKTTYSIINGEGHEFEGKDLKSIFEKS